MTLQFPTQAEQVLAESLATGISISAICKKRGVPVERENFSPVTRRYVFDDDTSIETTGAGSNYKVEVLLP